MSLILSWSVRSTSLYVMARGGLKPSPNLDFGPLPRLLEILRTQFELIIVDGAAFASCPDARWLTAVTDGTSSWFGRVLPASAPSRNSSPASRQNVLWAWSSTNGKN